MSFEASIHAKAIDLARFALEATAEAGSGHPTTAASLAHLVAVLMYDHMRYDPADPAARGSDRLVLSEGHACPVVYAAAADLGIRIGKNGGRAMTREDALRLREIDSEIDGHPNPAEGFPFFPAATGSLGQGLSIACGLGLASRLDGSDARIFCIIGDGESREGQVWEAVDFLVDHDIRGVCPIFNCNRYGQTGPVSPQQSPETLAAKLRAAGMVVRTVDGHTPREIRAALRSHARSASREDARPVAVVARTVKGWGSPSLQERNLHGKPITGDDLGRAVAELGDTARRIGAARDETSIGRSSIRAATPPSPPAAPSSTASPPEFLEALEHFAPDDWNADSLATRKGYGLALRALGRSDPRVVVLDADVSNSTYSELFRDDSALAGRFFECAIAEQNMISCAVGLWQGGYRPFVSSFAKFLVRAYDQIEMGIITRAGVKFSGSHSGVSLAADGPSQMGLPDVAFFHALSGARFPGGAPFCYVLTPSDARSAYALTLAAAEHDGPCYLRTQRPDVPRLYDDDRFELGGHRVLTEGEDLLVIASGYMVHEAKKAIPSWLERGIRPTLLDLYSVPFDADALVKRIRRCNGIVLTVEDNYAAGIGAAVAGAATERGVSCRIRQMFIRRPPKSGRTPEDVLAHLGLSADDIAHAGVELAETAVATGRKTDSA